jgi:hypothetical protein
MMAILGFFMGPIGRWILISVASVGFMAWIRADARAPYAAKVTELETAIKNRDINAERDRKLAETHAVRAEELEHEITKLVAENGWTRLRPDELARLQQLAGRNAGQPKMRANAR